MPPLSHRLIMLLTVTLGLGIAPRLDAQEAPHPDAAATVVLFNRNAPRSEEVARRYAQGRGIPEENIFGMECPAREEITRAEFNTTLLRPLREWIQQRGLLRYASVPAGPATEVVYEAIHSSLKYVVLCYGVPLKIAHNPNAIPPSDFAGVRDELLTNRAAVDSELACLPRPSAPIAGFIENPLYRKTFAQLPHWNRQMVCVARLDGPTPESAIALAEDALEAERTGLYGRAFFDARGLTEARSGYQMGDTWVRGAHKLFEQRGWECVLDEREATFDEDTDATSCAIYTGWYEGQINGPFRPASFRFRRGAIAYHIHSWSAGTLRSATECWAGPLVARGAATLGCVYEPYLQMTPNVDVFFQRLLEGASFGEAAWSAQPFLSWMITVVGDPLYRPFAVPDEQRLADLESRFDRLTPGEKTGLAWIWRLKCRRLLLEGKKEEALAENYRQAARLKERTLWVGLANLYLQTGDLRRAAEAARAAADGPNEKETRAGTLLFAARTCAQARQWDAALEYYRALLTEKPRVPVFTARCEEARRAALAARRESDAQFFQNLIPPSK